MLRKVTLAMKFNKSAKELINNKPVVELTENFKKEIIVQNLRHEHIRNVNHFDKQLRSKELLISKEEIRKQIDKHIFKGGEGIVMAETRIRMLEEAFDDFDRPQAIRDAILIAEKEKELYSRMQESNPSLIKNENQGIIDVERIRQTYYSII
jgi:hypothetical protein